MMKKFLAFMMISGLFIFVACHNDTEEPETTEPEVVEIEGGPEVLEPEPEVEEMEEEPTVSDDFTAFNQFLTIDLGLSIDEVTAILGEAMSSTTMDLAGIESTTNLWMDINLSGTTSITVTFSDGYATSIVETLSDSSNVSMDDYNEISTGMTEAEVYEVLGVPYSIMLMEILDTTSTTVSWINRNLSSITITFRDDIVSSSLQSNLD